MPKFVIKVWDGNKDKETKYKTRGLVMSLTKDGRHVGTISVLFIKPSEIDLNIVGAEPTEVKEVKL